MTWFCDKKMLARIVSLFICLFFYFGNLFAQRNYVDSLFHSFQNQKSDEEKVLSLSKLSYYYSLLYPDSAIFYADKIIQFSKERNYTFGIAVGLLCKGEGLDRIGDYPNALEVAIEALDISDSLLTHQMYIKGKANGLIGHLYGLNGSEIDAEKYYRKSILNLQESGEFEEDLYLIYFGFAHRMLVKRQLDSAFLYMNKGRNGLSYIMRKRNPLPWLIMGNIYNSIGNLDSAAYYYRDGLSLSYEFNAQFIRAVLLNAIGYVFFQRMQIDSSIHYFKNSLDLGKQFNYELFIIESSSALSAIYESKNSDSALKYARIMIETKDKIFGERKLSQFQKVRFDAESRKKDMEHTKEEFRNLIRVYSLFAALSIILLIAGFFWHTNKQTKKANHLLKAQKEKIEKTLAELENTQAQLIQSEKMASLGELTAGIAHEIQNPLNFVNNFSEVNTDLIGELQTEMDKGNFDEAKAIAKDIAANEQKINHHGKRADAIVKGMLQHSRTSTHEKEPTDINSLADEYLRLAYHGLRAKDKNFNSALHTEFDQSIGKINIVPQDIGRVLLNLYNNAFYTVYEKSRQGITGFEPLVSVTTKKIGNIIEIRVIDNGMGVPDKVKGKIFQPFFTTKPTGQGTGLGLSLSYDIVKVQGGELKLETREGEGSEFIVQLHFN